MNNKSLDEMASLVACSVSGDRVALDALIRAIQPSVYKIAQRFLMNPIDAEDATQEILLKVITKLTQFDGRSQFTTWVYSVASNHLRDMKKASSMTFDEFDADLTDGLAEAPEDCMHTQMMLAEVRIGCTLALLQCLSSEARLTYILGEIFELDHKEAAAVLDVSPATFRKRLSRARSAITNFMMGHCGLIQPSNACRCSKRVVRAQQLGRVDRDNLVFATSRQDTQQFSEVLAEIRRLQTTQRAAALFRAQQQPAASQDFLRWLTTMLDGQEQRRLDSNIVN